MIRLSMHRSMPPDEAELFGRVTLIVKYPISDYVNGDFSPFSQYSYVASIPSSLSPLA